MPLAQSLQSPSPPVGQVLQSHLLAPLALKQVTLHSALLLLLLLLPHLREQSSKEPVGCASNLGTTVGPALRYELLLLDPAYASITLFFLFILFCEPVTKNSMVCRGTKASIAYRKRSLKTLESTVAS